MWHGPQYVAVRAGSHEAANRIAADHDDSPVYFDGVTLGVDCDCCGDRWSRAGSWDDDFENIDHCPHPDAVIIDVGEY